MRLPAIAAGLLALAACIEMPVSNVTRLAGGTISLQAPQGYCTDPVASRPQSDFIVLMPCASLGVDGPVPAVLGLVTVQAGAEGSGSIATDEGALRDFLTTARGRALLSAAGNSADIRILSTQAFDDQVMVHFTDAGDPPLTGLQQEEWRAFRNIGGRLVTIGVRGLATAPLRDGPGAALLKQAVAGVRPVQPAGTVTAAAEG